MDEEQIRLKANEIMLHSKGFMLFAVMDNGNLAMAGDTEDLSAAEVAGLTHYYENFDTEVEDETD